MWMSETQQPGNDSKCNRQYQVNNEFMDKNEMVQGVKRSVYLLQSDFILPLCFYNLKRW